MYCWSLAWRILRFTLLSEAPEKPSDGCSSSVHLIAAPWGTLSQVTQPSCSQITDPQKFCKIWSIQESPQRCESAVACCWVRGTECNILSTNPFEGGLHYLHYPHHSLALGQTTEKEHSLTHQQKIILKIYWALPPIRIILSFPRNQFLSSGSFHKPLILIHQRPDRRKTTITEN